MTVTFNQTEMADFQYEINDGELVNDILIIVGEPNEEVLVRGYDADSIAKYGRRSYKVDRPIVANVLADYATPIAQATAILDRNTEPYALVQMSIVGKTDALTVKILELEISDLVQITETTSGLTAVYFILESIDLTVDTSGLITATLGLVQARDSEVPT